MLSKLLTLTALVALATSSAVSAAPLPTGSWPASKGNVKSAKAIVVKKGEVFDGKMKTYDRSDMTCNGQGEGGSKDAMFLLEPGATLKNVIIGKHQGEGVHCDNSDCKLINVWWDAVCEDALSIKGGSANSVVRLEGGGARGAKDKVVQHNGQGRVDIDGFYVKDFGKLFRSCGNCKESHSRKVTISNVLAVNPKSAIAMVNKNFNDQATFRNVHVKSSKSKVKVCVWSQGTKPGSEPKELGNGPLPPLCNYGASDVRISK